jgi:hypothetical protein
MTDLVEQLVARIETHRLPILDIGHAAISPVYDGLSILNLPASLLGWFGGPDLPHPPIDIPQLDALADGARQVVCVLIDAVSLIRFRTWFDGLSPVLDPGSDSAILGSLTSVVPSTTSAALTTLWTGRSPAEHAIVGYELFLKEYGLVANMITHSPAAFEGGGGALYRAGFQPESELPVPTLGPSLVEAGVDAHAFLHYSIQRSGLSRMHYTDVKRHSYGGIPDLWIGVRQLAEEPLDHARLIWVYYGGVDGLSHRYGPDSEQAKADFRVFIRSLTDEFIANLDDEVRRQTLLLIVSDHGQTLTPNDPKFEIQNHPTLERDLHMLPTGENRMAFLYPRPGRVDAVREYFEHTWPEQFTLLDSAHALEAGLFGPGAPARQTLGRMGDFIAISADDAYLWWASRPNPLLGRHGGLSADEMLVPLFASRLG